MPMPMISSLVCCCDAATPSAAAAVLRPAEAMISSAAGSIWRVSAEITAIDARNLGRAGDPVGERLGIGLHLIAELLLHHRGGDDRREGLLEVGRLLA